MLADKRHNGLISISVLEDAVQKKAKKGLDPNDGRWITVNGRNIFINSAGLDLDSLKVGNAVDGEDKRTVTLQRKDKEGKIVTQKRAAYTDEYATRQARYKFSRAVVMAKNWGKITQALASEAKSKKMSREKATAASALLISQTGMRVGSKIGETGKAKTPPKKGKKVETFGATTLQRRHVKMDDGPPPSAKLAFYGKSGVFQRYTIKDPDTVSVIGDFMKGKGGPKDALFGYGGGKRANRGSVGDRLHDFDSHYKVKDMRTVVAMKVASDEVASILKSPPRVKYPPKQKRRTAEIKRKAAQKLARSIIVKISEKVANKLGNDAPTAEGSYINPEIFEYVLQKIGLEEHLDLKNPKTGKSTVLPSRFRDNMSKKLPDDVIIEAWKSPPEDKNLDDLAVAIDKEQSRPISKQFPIMINLFGIDVVRGMMAEYIDDEPNPDGLEAVFDRRYKDGIEEGLDNLDLLDRMIE